MSLCNGNGKCLTQCVCKCDKICICGHRDHNGYCPSKCCIPSNCRNYTYCNVRQPKWVSDIHNGMCMNCAAQMGPHKISDNIFECPVCLENKNIIILNCNHKICNECWYKITEKGNADYNYKSACPLCRNLNQW